MKNLFISVSFILISLIPVRAQETTFESFFKKVKKSICERNIGTFKNFLSDDIAFDESIGIQIFIEKTNLNDKNSVYWLYLEYVFQLGYKYQENYDVYQIPSINANKYHSYVITDDIYLYKKPSYNSLRLSKLNKGYVFKPLNNKFNSNVYVNKVGKEFESLSTCLTCWIQIKVDGKVGYVKTFKNIFYIGGPYVYIEKKNDEWKIVSINY